MGQFLNLLLVLGSLGGIGYIVYRKIPLLTALPPNGEQSEDLANEENRKSAITQKISPEKILGTALLKARNLAAKTETQTAQWLERFSKNSDERKEEFRQSYWDRLRKKKK